MSACGGADEPSAPHPLAACAEAPSSPTNIAETLGSIDALVENTIPCLIANLARPLEVAASTSQFSAQPAFDDANPRLFVFLDGVVLTVVPDGVGKDLLEFGEWTSTSRTIKAELKFPPSLPVEPSAPYEKVLNTSTTVSGIATNCSVCHGVEQQELEIDGVHGYSSIAYRPIDSAVLPWTVVEQERWACADDDRSGRCDLLRALIDFGVVEPTEFGDEVATFTDN
jgi:hypothetical protein